MAQTTKTLQKKMVYFFGAGRADGKAVMKNILGGKENENRIRRE